MPVRLIISRWSPRKSKLPRQPGRPRLGSVVSNRFELTVKPDPSKHYLESELCFERRTGQTADLAKRRGIQVAIGIAEVHTIRDVEYLGAELHSDLFRYPEI